MKCYIIKLSIPQEYVSRTASQFGSYAYSRKWTMPPKTKEKERAYIWFSLKEATRAYECIIKWWIDCQLLECEMEVKECIYLS